MRLVATPEVEIVVPRVTMPVLELECRHVDLSVLDLDCETVAAGFADPDWVPQKIMAVAYSFIGEEEVHVHICGPGGFMGSRSAALRRKMLKPLLEAMREADVWTAHNLIRFDLPVISAECVRLGLPLLPSRMVEDTIRFPVRTKGLKKGQDVLALQADLVEEKLPMNWEQWQRAYDEPGWPSIIERCAGDVRQHKALREDRIRKGTMPRRTRWTGARN